MKFKPLPFFFLLVVLTSTSSCLKTRAQLRDAPQTRTPSSDGSHARVTSINPEGGYIIDEIKNELTILSGRIEDLERAKNQTPDQQETFEMRITEIEKNQLEILEKLNQLEKKLPPPDPEAAFRQAKEDYRAGKLESSILGFNRYLKQKKIKNREEATFLRGEASFEKRSFKKAINDYARFIENEFPKSKFKPRALYKIALSYEELGWDEDAKVFYQELVDRFPKSPQTKLARAKLGIGKKSKNKRSSKNKKGS